MSSRRKDTFADDRPSYRSRRSYRRPYPRRRYEEIRSVRSRPKEDSDWLSKYVIPGLRFAAPIINGLGTALGVPGVGTALQTTGEIGHLAYDSFGSDRDGDSQGGSFDDPFEYDEPWYFNDTDEY